MRYAGGKNKFANKLANIIGSGDLLIEPFIGGGAMTAALAPSFNKVYAYDIHVDLVLMWRALLEGWIPPSNVSKTEYNRLKEQHSSALRGFVGFGCAFGGAWFSGYSVDLRTGRQNYALEAKNLLLRKVKRMQNVVVDLEYYQNLVVPPGATVYADPPYANAVAYKSELKRDEFNSREFWQIADGWADNGATIFVSEFNAPGGWSIVWEQERTIMLSYTTVGETKVERLFCKG